MAQAAFADPIDALNAVAVCLADLTVANPDSTEEDPLPPLEPTIFIGDDGVGGNIDCCANGKPILRIESGGELPGDGLPFTIGKGGCIEFVEQIVVTFLTCFKTANKNGAPLPADELGYTLELIAARWSALTMLRCCEDPRIKFLNSSPINPDGKCAGFEIRLAANLKVCDCPPDTPDVSSG